ncbi:riboflavin biosynthesis protein ribAB [gamma proteobacterium HTCC5015]|nr:riboflavin biosynthesis protein ribAB [gamma proteobacterium HTCC5015]
MAFNTVDEIIDDLKQGKMVIIVDDEDRENEGDLLMAAEHITPEAINFMATHGRGLICLTLTEQRCRQLGLPLMRQHGEAHHATNFTVSIEAAEGVTTGISAADRAVTVKAAVAREAKAEDLVQPGHIFPLMAREGGVLVRAGHTEAGCDFARMANCEPASVIVEILNDDGTMARRDDLEVFAEKHDLKIGTIEDLIRYRVENERTVELMHSTPFTTAYGTFELHAYTDTIKNQTHLAVVKGDIKPGETSLVRVHVEQPLHDAFSAVTGHGWPLHDAMQRLADCDQGVVVLLRQTGPQEDILEQVKQHNDEAKSANKKAEAAGSSRKRSVAPEYLWAYGVGAQILTDLGVSRMRLMSAPKAFHGLAGFGLEIEEYVKP